LIGLDTNVLVRFLVRDDEAQAQRARRLFEREISAAQPAFVSLVTLAELAWVLRSRYRATREEVVQIVESLLAEPHVRVQDEDAVWLALEDVDQLRVDFADALIAGLNRLHGCSHTVTFDDRTGRIPGTRHLQ
jgi:predicted nucleic-acid-binding protein